MRKPTRPSARGLALLALLAGLVLGSAAPASATHPGAATHAGTTRSAAHSAGHAGPVHADDWWI